MCHEFWTRRELRREERLDEELRHLIDDDRPRPERPMPVAGRDRDEAPKQPDRARLETAARS